MNILTHDDGSFNEKVSYKMLRDHLDCVIMTIRDCFPGVYMRDFDDLSAARMLIYTYVIGIQYYEEVDSDFCIIMESMDKDDIANRREFLDNFCHRFTGEVFFDPDNHDCRISRANRTGPPNCVYERRDCIYCNFIYNLGVKTRVYVRMMKYHYKMDGLCSFTPQ